MPPTRQGPANTESVDNYLKAILTLSGPAERRVSSSSLADRLGLRPLPSPICCKSWHRVRRRLWNTKVTRESSCRGQADGGRLRWCVIIA